MLETLDHVIIVVRDLAASIESFGRLLGRRPSWRGGHPSQGTAGALFHLDNTCVELLAAQARGPVADKVEDRLAQRGEGLFALCFGTGDARACARELRARGLSVEDPADGGGREAITGAERRWRSFALSEQETRGVFVHVIEHRSPRSLVPLAPPQQDARAAISACDHVVVRSPAAGAARSLYGERLGLRLALDKAFPEWGVRLVFFRIGGITVEIASPLDPCSADDGDRLWGIAYRVPDLDAARVRLAGQGFDVSEVRPGRRPRTRVCTVRGEPCGVATLLLTTTEGDGVNDHARELHARPGDH
jgi:catechol 2,3-dioxygenase-like lactoylglutathione lyase family enzyme